MEEIYNSAISIDDEPSRPGDAGAWRWAAPPWPAYEYNGLATLVGTEYPEPDALYTRYTSGPTFDRLDTFNRP